MVMELLQSGQSSPLIA